MNPQEMFVTRLRRQRLRARVSVEQIADTLRIKPELIAAFENNDLSEWPRGLYARSWIRAYASAVGLDPIDTVDEFCRLFPQGDRRVQPTIEEMAAIVSHPSEYTQEVNPEQERRRSSPEFNVLQKQPWHVAAAGALSNAGRALWMRAASLIPAPHARTKRQPRTSL
jgi:cytoskeletal protein RodZ